MGKILLIALALLGAAYYYPGTRPVVVDTLGPVVRPVVNPVLGWSTRGEIKRIVRDLRQLDQAYNRTLPEGDADFKTWLGNEYEGDARKDSWEQDYQLRVWADSFAVISGGADGLPGTGDDIRVTAERTRPPR